MGRTCYAPPPPHPPLERICALSSATLASSDVSHLSTSCDSDGVEVQIKVNTVLEMPHPSNILCLRHNTTAAGYAGQCGNVSA